MKQLDNSFENFYTRRKFLRDLSQNVGATALAIPGFSIIAQACGQINEKSQEQNTAQNPDRKIGIALVGLGSYSSGQLAPALQETKLCRLAGIVTGTPSKAEQWSKQYNIPQKNIYNYQNFDQIADNPNIDVIYVVLPIAMHAAYTIRAAQAGKHVICEKPMAVSASDCEQMIAACKKANKMLSIGYRLHFEPYNMEMMRLGQKKIYGAVQKIDSSNGYTYNGTSNPEENWRLSKKMAGGGPLMDMGVYVVQGACYVTGEVPIAVTARKEVKRPELFKEVEETMYWQMEFPSGAIADCTASYGMGGNHLRVKAELGNFELSQAFRYGGMAGKTDKGKMNFPEVNQQALQMDDFANCILNNKQTRVPGEMGLRDMRIIEAIYKAAETGSKVRV